MTPKERAENYMRLKKGYKSSKDEFAIAFAEWADDNYFRMGNTSIWSDSTNWDDNIKITTKELLEEFKKENYDSR